MKGCGRAREFVDVLCAGGKFHGKHRIPLRNQHLGHYKNHARSGTATVILTALILVAGNTERNGSKECEEYGKWSRY